MDRLIQLRDFHRHDPDNDLIVIDLVDEMLCRGLLGEAQAVLEALAPARQAKPEFLFRIGRCALSRGDFDEAAKALQSCVATGGDVPAVRHDLAFALLGAKQLDEAERVLAPVLVHSVDQPYIGILHARLLQHRRQYEAAAAIVQAIVDAHPLNSEAWGLLAMVRLDMVDVDSARHAATSALSVDAEQSDALTVLATLALWAHDPQASFNAFSHVLSGQPRAGRALSGAGESLMLMGDIVGARAFLDRAVIAMPNHIGTWHALAWCDLLQGDIDHAQACFQEAFDLDRNFGETHGGFALIHALLGQTEDARQAIKRALRLDTNSRNARYAQSLLWSAEGREREAAALVDGILAEAGVNTAQRPVDFIKQLQARLQPIGRA